MKVVNGKAGRVGCREAQPNRTDTTRALTSRLLGRERRNSLRSLAPCVFHRQGWTLAMSVHGPLRHVSARFPAGGSALVAMQVRGEVPP